MLGPSLQQEHHELDGLVSNPKGLKQKLQVDVQAAKDMLDHTLQKRNEAIDAAEKAHIRAGSLTEKLVAQEQALSDERYMGIWPETVAGRCLSMRRA